MKYYIASKLENVANVLALRDWLNFNGHMQTYDWTTHGSVQHEGAARLIEVAELETRGVLNADVVIVLLPGGRGTHAELGIAIGAGKPVVLAAADESCFLADERTCAFYHARGVYRYIGGTLDGLIKYAEKAVSEKKARLQEKINTAKLFVNELHKAMHGGKV